MLILPFGPILLRDAMLPLIDRRRLPCAEPGRELGVVPLMLLMPWRDRSRLTMVAGA